MKKIMILLTMLFAIGQWSTVQAENTDLSLIDNVIYITPFSAEAGSEIIVSFSMKNSAEIRGFQFDLYLPEGITVVKSAKERVQGSLSASRLPDEDEHDLTFSEQPDGAIRILCSSQYDETFTGNDGEIITLNVKVDSEMEAGDYPIYLRNMKLTETDISKYYEHSQIETTVTIGSATGINEVKHETNSDGGCYNLNGQRVTQPTKGMYIVNGRKVVVR